MSAPDSATVTRLLEAARSGEQEALRALFPLVYEALHAQARKQRQRWHGNLTLNTTALVHEAYLKLADQSEMPWQSRAHFFGVAAQAMRHLLIDYAKQQQRIKRGGQVRKMSLDDVVGGLPDAARTHLDAHADDLLALDAALTRLAKINERQSRVVECRYFAGLTIDDTAAALDLSPATVKRYWVHARAWLARELQSNHV